MFDYSFHFTSRFYILAVALLCVLLGSPRASSSPDAVSPDQIALDGRILGGVAGTIVTAERIAPLASGDLRRSSLDDSGFYSFPRLEPGLWRLRIPAAESGHLQRVVPLFAPRVLQGFDQPAVADAASVPEGWSPAGVEAASREIVVRGRVYAVTEDAVVPGDGFWVWIDGLEDELQRTGSDGTYRLRAPRGNRIVLRAVAAGYLPLDLPFELQQDEVDQKGPDLVLRPAVSIVGCIEDEAGRPLNEARLDIETAGETARRSRAKIRPTAWTNVDGCFADQVAIGQIVRLTAHAPGYLPQSKVIDPKRPPTTIDFRLARLAAASGSVFDAGGLPVDDAKVTLVGDGSRTELLAVLAGRESANRRHPSATTERDGTFLIRDVPTGSHSVVVTAPGYEPTIVPGVQVQASGSTTDVGSLFLAPAAAIQGEVVDETGAAVSGATIWVSLLTPDLRASAARLVPVESDQKGRFSIGDLVHEQPVKIRITKPGFMTQTMTVVPPQFLVVTLERGAALSGRVLDERRRPIVGAHLSVEVSGNRPTALLPLDERRSIAVETRSGEDGAFRLLPIAPGPIEVRAESPCCRPSIQRVELSSGEIVDDFEIILRSGSALTGTVVDPEGFPVADAVVSAMDKRTRSDADGRFSLAGLPDGRLTITARHSEFGIVDATIEDTGEGVQLRFTRTGTLVGRVIDAAGDGLGDVRVLIASQRSPAMISSTTDSDGGFQFALQSGRYRVQAVLAGRSEVAEAVVEIGEGRTTETLLTFRSTCTIVGRILGVTATDLGRVAVRAVSESGIPVYGDIDFEGNYVIEGASPGHLRIIAEFADGRRAEAQVTLIEGQELAEIDLDPTDGLRLAGRVHLDGEPLSGAQLTVTSISGRPIAATVTDTEGHFIVNGLAEEPVKVRARTPLGDFQVDRLIDPLHEPAIEVDIRTGGLSGIVSDGRTGTVVGGVPIELSATGQPTRHLTARADGTFGPIQLVAGIYFLDIGGQEGAPAQIPVEVLPGRETEVHLLFDAD